MGNFKYPKGSEWRKWDLQIHTPFSILNNQFGDPNNEETWDNYVKELFKKAIEKNIAAIGITDYFVIDGYEKIMNEYLSNDLKLKKIFTHDEIKKILEIPIFPNIEFRLKTFVGGNSINFHVLFSNKIPINEIKENFLHELDFAYEGNPQNQDEMRKLKIENLRSLGKKLKREHGKFQSEDDVFIGMKNAVVNDSQIHEVLNKKPSIFKDKFLIALPADEDLSEINWDSMDHNTRKILIQKSDILFSSNQNTRDWALGKKYKNMENDIDEFKSLKPCVWSSDAHSFDKLFEPDLRRYTWIKADPTFEGLKQILYEPEERVYIGEEPSRNFERNKIIKSIFISSSNNWFENSVLPLNEGLISIIGGKGTGKTAVLDLIAYATKSYKCYEKDENKSKSFLKRAFKALKGTKIKVEWEDDISDEIEVLDKLEEFIEKEGKVRYLPQDYVDQLCTELGKNEFEKQIEDVIFQKIPPENKATYADFESYKDAQLKVINSKKKRVTEEIIKINSQIYYNSKLIKSKPSKDEEIKKIEEEIKKYEIEIEKISEAVKDSKEQKKILNNLQSLNEKKSNLEKIITQLKNSLLKIEEIKNDTSIFIENLSVFLKNLKNDLEVVGISKEIIEKVNVVIYPRDLDKKLNQRKKVTEKEIEEKNNELRKILKQVTDEIKKIKLEKSKQDEIIEINKSLSELRKKKVTLSDNIKKIEDAKKILPDLVEKRDDLFIDFFLLIFEEKEILKDIYLPLENSLKMSGEENEKLFDFAVKFNFDINSMAYEGHELLDLRADGIFRQSRPEMLRENFEKLKFNINLENKEISEDDKESIKSFLKNVEELFTKDKRMVASQLKEKKYTEEDFYNWLYSTKYYNISYSIKFNNIELKNLSPGLKGVALLILFLELDEKDRRPILIDQPEENLDNRSVYNTLVKYFRNAKKRRQVIIVTHNPNLVVNTDSEQVIVTDFDYGLEKQHSRIFYVSGSLENTFKDDSSIIALEKQGIREHVCLILEGGKDAFEKREKKYGFKTI